MGVMDRLVLSDAAWERMAPLIIGRPDQKGSTGRRAHQHAAGAKKGGLKIKRKTKRSAARAGA